MSIIEFLADLGEQGVHLWIEDERLRYRAPQPLSESTRSEIVRQRSEILRFLRHSQEQPTSDELQIPAAPRDEPLPLSFAQERLWFLEQWQSNSVAYHIPLLIRLRGRLDRAVLRASIAAIVQRHESLRTTFSMDLTSGQPIQTIHADLPIDLCERDLRAVAPAEREEQALRVSAEEARRPLDLQRGPLTRMALIQLEPTDHLLLVVMHHIITDGWSMHILTQEFGALYQAALSGAPAALPALPIQYADFAVWQRERLQGRLREQLLAYWRQQLHDAPTLIELPTDRPRPPIQTFRGANQEFVLSQTLTAALRGLSQRTDSTLFMTLLTAYMSLLARYTGQADVVVGSPIANRTHHATRGVIGFFVNMLALRADLRDNPPMLDALARVRQICLQAYQHQDTPFEQLVELLQPPRSMSRHPLVQAVFVLQNTPDAVIDLPELRLTPVGIDNQTAKFDLTLAMHEEQDRLHASIEYNADLFEASTIGLLIQRFQTLLQALVDDPAQRLAELPLLTPPERAALIRRWDREYQPFSAARCLHTMFEAHSARTPDAIAVGDERSQLSYAELNARANQLAHYLRSRGVRSETLVGFYLDRSVQMIVAALAILKAGGAYVPLDPGYPAERIALILDDAQITVVLTQRDLADQLPARLAQPILLDDDWPAIAAGPIENPRTPSTPDQLAYVIYTSGSTGRPKGALLSHRHVARLFAATQDWFQFDQHDVWSLFHSIAFDFSVWEVWGALLYGGRLVIVSHMTSRSPEAFAALLRTEQVTVLNQTPSAFRQLIPADATLPATLPPSALRYVIFGGEALDPASLRPWFERYGDQRPQLVNMYGITETTVHVTYRPIRQHEAAADARSLIGQPIPDLHLYLLDPRGEPAPAGLPGELYVGGAGVARGYLHRPALTAERFVPNPFSAEPGARLYRSGDLGRETYDGDIEYLGRIDQQVKLRGFRIELGEISAALQGHPALSEAAVVVAQDAAGGPRLIAYIVAQTPPNASELRSFLKQRLPEYMIPAAFVPLAALPLTPNGKLDRKALPAPESARMQTDAPFVPPTTPDEQRMAAIWAETLGLAEVGIHDNFFALGGDSIRSVQVLALARTHGLEFTIQDLFQHQTIAELLEHVQPAASVALAPPPVAPFALVEDADRAQMAADIEDAYPLTTLQSGMLFHSAADVETGVYHDVVSIHLRGRLDLRLLRAAIDQLAAQHAILRTSFDLVTYQEPLQLVHRSVTPPLAVADLRALSEEDADAAIEAWLTSERLQPFHWQQAPLLRFQLHRRSAETFQLSVSFHHAILDGWSLASLFTELLQRYVRLLIDPHAPVLAPPPLTFRAYVALERQALASEEHCTFWRAKLQERASLRVPRLGRAAPDDAAANMPLRQPTPIPPEVSHGLHQLAQQAQVPIKSVLLAAHLRVLALIGGASDILTGLVTHGRPQAAGSERVLGMFLNTIPFRQRLDGGSWRDLVRSVFETECEMQRFVHYPMPAIQQLVGGEPLFEIIFNFTHFHVYRQIASISEIEVLGSTAFERTNFVLGADFNLDQDTNQIDLRLEGDPRVVDADQLARIAGYYERTLAAMAAAPDQPYHTFSPLSRSEHEQLVVTWNPTPAPAAEDAACIHELFAAQARRTPDRIAVSAAEGQLTYAELNERADRLALRLRQRGVGPETLVALIMERSIEAVVAIIAVWKAGGAYVPISPDAPEQRLRFMLTDTRSVATLTTARIAASLTGLPSVICVDAAQDEPAPDERPLPEADPDQLAYVIYTSGSTGLPKGVMVAHRSVVNLVRAVNDHIPPGVAEPMRIGYSVSLVFDVSVQLLVQLCSGHTLVVIPPSASQNAEELLSLFESAQVDFLECTPTQLRMLYVALQSRPRSLPGIMHIGGEALDAELWRWLASQSAVHASNSYGPTECTVTASIAPMRSADLVPVIGGPLHNLQFYILDAQLQPLPVGVAGELYIGGAGVARGYLNRPALTAEKFVPDPFSGVAQRQPGARLYRSGDLARYLPDGNIEYLGRIDNQIKLRGYRIELGEIEAVLRQQPAVQDAAVALHEDAPGDARLVAYVTAAAPDDHGEPSARDEQLHTALAERLPAYTLPTAYIWLATLPLLPSGKVDRRSLPQPERRRIERSFSPPRTPLEQAIAQVWSDTLGVTPIGIDDNFFALGGHSLTAMRLMAQIERRVGVSLPLTALLQGGTVAELAAAIQQRQGAAPFQALVPIQPSGSQPPFFCIHPAGGDVLCYRELAVQLGATQPFYGLQAAGIYGEQAPDGTIEALAARYLAALQTQQPEGPYYLGGWSVGGVVAVELARQLQERGQAVAALVLIDSQPADATDRAESQLDLLASFAAQIGLNLDQLAFLRDDLEALPPEERIGFALTQLRRTAILPADLSADDLTNRFRVFEAHVLAMQHYRPRQLSGAMTLIQAAERDSDAAAAAAAWSRQIDELTVHSVPGDHLTMLRAPHVATLARVLSGCLAQAALEIASEQRSAR